MTFNRFAKYVWFVVGFNILVILWGAFVRATGSGAGCGSHWPLCNGAVVPLGRDVETLIEYTHRTMSGVALLLVFGMVVWALRRYERGSPVRTAALASGVLIISEALIGAALVLFGWVGVDRSSARVVSISLHLVNTFLLLAALVLTGWWASGGGFVDLRAHRNQVVLLAFALGGVLLVGMTGALTALGDTLFPARSLAEGLQQDISASTEALVRLRVVHPLIAVAVGTYLIVLTFRIGERTDWSSVRLGSVLRILVLTQLAAGVINVVLLAPTWMQLLHLLLADLVWITLVLYSASLLAVQRLSGKVGQAAPRSAFGEPAI